MEKHKCTGNSLSTQATINHCMKENNLTDDDVFIIFGKDTTVEEAHYMLQGAIDDGRKLLIIEDIDKLK